MTDCSEVTSLSGVSITEKNKRDTDAYKDTSCFQTGLCAEMREPKRPASCDLPDPSDEDGVFCWLPRALPLPFTLSLIAPRADSAVDEETRERLVATPLTSLSVSSVGSRLTNSFCSN